ncbi:PEGA domain-containing protein [Methanoregula sp.]|uniref:PEGA domain-containing protein n=1 Tax=Methanoregula sp. TaxID=2052170 RepID=UPI002CEA7E51|nr:PEGA domain-containing protein [Methanoregula sp.]HVP95864.1 PEGA domain-containing protein [Methanoregula sp.]
MRKVFLLVLFVCIALIGCAMAVTPAGNQTVAANVTTAPQLIGGDMGTYLVTANVEGANVTFDADYKGAITGGQLAVPVYTTGTPYRTITVQAPGYADYTANITQYPGKNETVDIPVTLVPLAAANTTAVQSNATAAVTPETTTAAPVSPAPTTAGSLPFAACGAFVVLGILAIRSRR